MDVKISHNWLKEFLETNATPSKIAECLALSGPSVERVRDVGKDTIYDIEITTNRVDSASVMGIAREAAAILPQFGIKAKLKFQAPKTKFEIYSKSQKLKIKINPKINKRVMAVVIEGVKVEKSPKWMSERLESAGVRSLNLLVDITNYVMLETGHPTHVFDLDKIPNHTLQFRLSKKGEEVITFDNKKYSLPGNDIVIASVDGEIIDLPGIMGTKNSVVGESTKRIIFFIDNNDPLLIRKTSLALGIRTMAVQLNEKGVDPRLGSIALERGLNLYLTMAHGKQTSKVTDLFPGKPKITSITTSLEFIQDRLGIEIKPEKINSILESLGFDVSYTAKSKTFSITPPSFRILDVTIAEDIVEEVARIYGYHNLPSRLMEGQVPADRPHTSFDFEIKVKQLLKGWGGVEVYNMSLVAKEFAGDRAIKLKNPLGADTQYLRTTLYYSLFNAYTQNIGRFDKIHLFEMANVYIQRKNDLPEEKMMLGGVLSGFDFRHAKGIVQALLEALHITAEEIQPKTQSLALEFYVDKQFIGHMLMKNEVVYYEFPVELLKSVSRPYPRFVPISKYPVQIEDITLVIPQGTQIGTVIRCMMGAHKNIKKVTLEDIFQNAYTFRVQYHHLGKTLTASEVASIREKILKTVRTKFNAIVK
jgi:phenylalanyl-tRNA synthetase beta chain